MIVRKTYTLAGGSEPTYEFEMTREGMFTLGIIGGIGLTQADGSVGNSPPKDYETTLNQLYERVAEARAFLDADWREQEKARASRPTKLQISESRKLDLIIDWACSDKVVSTTKTQNSPLASVVQGAFDLRTAIARAEDFADKKGPWLITEIVRGGGRFEPRNYNLNHAMAVEVAGSRNPQVSLTVSSCRLRTSAI